MIDLQQPRYRYFSFHESLPRFMYAFFTVPIIVGLLLLTSHRVPTLLCWWFIILPLIAVTDREVEVDTHRRILVTRWMPFRLVTTFKKTEPLSNYEAITCRRGPHHGGRGSSTSTSEWEWIALVRSSGKFRWIQHVPAIKKEICPAGQATSQRLARATGLPIRGYPDAIFHRAAPME